MRNSFLVRLELRPGSCTGNDGDGSAKHTAGHDGKIETSIETAPGLAKAAMPVFGKAGGVASSRRRGLGAIQPGNHALEPHGGAGTTAAPVVLLRGPRSPAAGLLPPSSYPALRKGRGGGTPAGRQIIYHSIKNTHPFPKSGAAGSRKQRRLTRVALSESTGIDISTCQVQFVQYPRVTSVSHCLVNLRSVPSAYLPALPWCSRPVAPLVDIRVDGAQLTTAIAPATRVHYSWSVTYSYQNTLMQTIDKISIALPRQMVVTVKDAVSDGEYASTSEVIREALRDWMDKRSRQRHGIESLRRLWREALDDPKPGASVDSVLDRLEQKYQAMQSAPRAADAG